jgi:hypothetical protein
MLLTHLALTQNTDSFAFHQIYTTTNKSDTQHQLSSTDNQHATGIFNWLFDGFESLNESEDLVEEDNDDEHQPQQCAQVCILCSLNHQIKFVSLNQGYIQNFVPFKQAPLFVMFHSWKSYLS